MAIVCNRLPQIKSIYKTKLLESLSSLNNSAVSNLSFKNSLNLIYYLSASSLTNNSTYQNLEQALSDQLKNNCLNNNILEAFQIAFHSNSPNSIIQKYVNHIIDNNEFLKDSQLAELNSLINSKNFSSLVSNDFLTDAKRRTNNNNHKAMKINLYKKKSKIQKRSDLLTALDINKTSFDHFSYDPENQVISLRMGEDKEDNDSANLLSSTSINKSVNEFNKSISFVELEDTSSTGLSLYQSLINTLKPNKILINNEPLEYLEFNNKENKVINKSISSFKDHQAYLNMIKEMGVYKIRPLNNEIFYKSNDLAITESIICYACYNNISTELFDLPTSDFLISFYKYTNSLSKDKLNDLNQLTKVTHLLSLINWINIQENSGCVKCANYFGRKAIPSQPLSLEFLIDKSLFPNYSIINSYRISKLVDSFNNNDRVLVFSNDIFKDAANFSSYYEKILESEKNNTSYDISFNCNNSPIYCFDEISKDYFSTFEKVDVKEEFIKKEIVNKEFLRGLMYKDNQEKYIVNEFVSNKDNDILKINNVKDLIGKDINEKEIKINKSILCNASFNEDEKKLINSNLNSVYNELYFSNDKDILDYFTEKGDRLNDCGITDFINKKI